MTKQAGGWLNDFFSAGTAVVVTSFILLRLLPAIYHLSQPYAIVVVFGAPLLIAALLVLSREIKFRRPRPSASATGAGAGADSAGKNVAPDETVDDPPFRLKIFNYELTPFQTELLLGVPFTSIWWLLERLVTSYIPGPIGTALSFIASVLLCITIGILFLVFKRHRQSQKY